MSIDTKRGIKVGLVVAALYALSSGVCQAASAVEYGLLFSLYLTTPLKTTAVNFTPCLNSLGTASDYDNDKDDFGIIIRDGSHVNVVGCRIATNADLAVKSNASLTSVVSTVNPGQKGIFVVGNAVIRPTTTVTPAPILNQNQTFDSYATFGSGFSSINNSDSAPCDAAHTNLRIVGPTTATLSPGTYCGGIFIKDANVGLTPGLYVMRDGDFTARGNSNITTIVDADGNGALITFSAVNITDKIGNLSVITNGTFSLKGGFNNLAVVQYISPDVTNSCSGEHKKGSFNEISAKSVELQGIFYTPHRKLVINSINNSNPSPICSFIYALSIDLSGNLTLGNDNDGCKALFAYLFPPPTTP